MQVTMQKWETPTALQRISADVTLSPFEDLMRTKPKQAGMAGPTIQLCLNPSVLQHPKRDRAASSVSEPQPDTCLCSSLGEEESLYQTWQCKCNLSQCAPKVRMTWGQKMSTSSLLPSPLLPPDVGNLATLWTLMPNFWASSHQEQLM